jgi:transposase InsO family protein
VFFVIDVASRRVQIAGIDQCPDEDWMKQAARRLTEADSGFLNGKQFLIHDRDPLFGKEFQGTLRQAGVRCLRMPKQSPNLNAYSERFVQTIKSECLEKMVIFGEKHLRYVVDEFVAHYHQERPHQGLGNRRIMESGQDPPDRGRILCRERLGGLLKTYYRKAA